MMYTAMLQKLKVLQVLLVNEIRNKKDPYYKLGYTVIDLLDYNNVKIENTQKQQFTVHRDRLRKI